jgi:Uma2 family endonuclease
LFSIIVDSNHAADHLLSMHAITESDQCIVLEGVSWDGYVQIDEMLGESRSIRLKFADDRLEIKSASRSHEHIKSNIGRMIELYCRREKIFFQTEGSATLRRLGKRGGEPDESYNFTKGKEEAELVIEAALTSGGIDKLDFYRGLQMPEVWIWEHDNLTVYRFEEGDYKQINRSSLLPGLDLSLVARLAGHPYTSEVLDRFEAALEEN